MFRALLCPSSGAREYYTSGCCLSYLVLGFQVVGMVWSWGLCVRFAGCWQQPANSSVASSWHFISIYINDHIFWTSLVPIFFPNRMQNGEITGEFSFTPLSKVILLLCWLVRNSRLLTELRGDPVHLISRKSFKKCGTYVLKLCQPISKERLPLSRFSRDSRLLDDSFL